MALQGQMDNVVMPPFLWSYNVKRNNALMVIQCQNKSVLMAIQGQMDQCSYGQEV